MAKYTELFAEYLESGEELPLGYNRMQRNNKGHGNISCLFPFPLCDRYLTNVNCVCN